MAFNEYEQEPEKFLDLVAASIPNKMWLNQTTVNTHV